MHTIQLSDETYDAIANRHGDVSAFVESLAKRELAEDASLETPRFDLEKVRDGFRQLQGMFGDASLEKVLEDRKLGRE